MESQKLKVSIFHLMTLITINDMRKNNLMLMQSILDKALMGMGMNLLAFCTQDWIYYGKTGQSP